ncbi:glycyl-tRNA synthetase subunit beta [Erythrobacter longus]|uniref:Glycine--tRNA ligase beta subunit n=1 Tax=Erythrobacter longus TaxID=1044 RepID=A0A074MD40_ERYLO|nr:glycine--tRNA ligase subunit beta [Erythrobacter longus]KEO91389.1 glycyl-tRNA synthetase subunit beta [Erythrobacter longus]
MADFLLELLTEEIPARMQKGARTELEKLFTRELSASGVSAGDITVWSTPRRLTLVARDLPTETEAVREEAKGPPVGAPDQAVDGFCRKNGVSRDSLEERDVKGRTTYFAVIEKPGQQVSDLLAASIPTIIRDFAWPKSMRWGEASISSESTRWVRPLSGIVALLGGEIVPVVMDGLSSGRETMGHRFHSAGPIRIDGADDYAAKLRAAHVIVDHEERAAIIRDGAKSAAEAAGLVLVVDEGLVVENAGLTEWPVPLLGRFDEEFLDVPPEVIQLTARVNQKYFVCEDASGKLANAFICTANIDAADPAVVVDGNRKVLAARLADARFFWELDQKTTLAQHATKLERITFHEKLGTVADKVERVAKLARWLCEEGIVTPRSPAKAGAQLQNEDDGLLRSQEITREELADLAEQAARLCKADLVTEMVGEFPELQGLMGGYYAEKEGLPQEVSDAIRDHYKPVGQGDEVPTAPVTVAVSLADKLDTLVSFFWVNEKPTGSKDPFALRRAAIAEARLTQDNLLRIPLLHAIAAATACLVETAMNWAGRTQAISMDTIKEWRSVIDGRDFPGRLELLDEAKVDLAEVRSEAEAAMALLRTLKVDAEAAVAKYAEILDFFADRLKVQQREAGVRHDLIDAVFALGGEDDLVRLLARVHALQSFIATDNGANLLAGYKRAANILKKEGHVTPAQAGVQSSDEDQAVLDSGLRRNDDAGLSHTPEPAEAALIAALDEAEPKATSAIEAEDFEAAMEALASLRGPIDDFFEAVIVNAEDKNVRASRLSLLARLRDAVHKVADFSRIEG